MPLGGIVGRVVDVDDRSASCGDPAAPEGFCLPNGEDGLEEEFEACFPDEFPTETGLEAATSEGDGEEPPSTTVPEEPGFDCLFEFYDVFFTVEGGTPPSTVPPGTGTPPPVAPPATPVTEEPPFTG